MPLSNWLNVSDLLLSRNLPKASFWDWPTVSSTFFKSYSVYTPKCYSWVPWSRHNYAFAHLVYTRKLVSYTWTLFHLPWQSSSQVKSWCKKRTNKLGSRSSSLSAFFWPGTKRDQSFLGICCMNVWLPIRDEAILLIIPYSHIPTRCATTYKSQIPVIYAPPDTHRLHHRFLIL